METLLPLSNSWSSTRPRTPVKRREAWALVVWRMCRRWFRSAAISRAYEEEEIRKGPVCKRFILLLGSYPCLAYLSTRRLSGRVIRLKIIGGKRCFHDSMTSFMLDVPCCSGNSSPRNSQRCPIFDRDRPENSQRCPKFVHTNKHRDLGCVNTSTYTVRVPYLRIWTRRLTDARRNTFKKSKAKIHR